MKKNLRVVIDTNIFVSALLGSRNCRFIINAFEDSLLTLILSEFLIKELIQTLTGLKRASRKKCLDLSRSMRANSKIVTPRERIRLCRDPEEDKFLEAAVSGHADFVVTEDKDLLELESVEGIAIITPKEFINMLKDS